MAIWSEDKYAAAKLELFNFHELPPEGQSQVASVRDLYARFAEAVVAGSHSGPELTRALDWLLLSKDAAVRSVVAAWRQPPVLSD